VNDEEDLKGALESAFEGISRLDAQGRYVYVNAAYAALLGRTPAELIGTSWEVTVYPEDRPIARAAYELMVRTGKGRFTARALRKDGTIVPKDVVMVRARHGSGHFCFMHDASGRLGPEALRADVAHAFMKRMESRAVLQSCTEAIVRHLGVAFARIWLLDESERVLVPQASAGTHAHLDGPHGRVPLGEREIGRIAQDGKPLFSNSVLAEPWLRDVEWATRERMVAFAGCPLKVDERVLGVVAVFSQVPLDKPAFDGLYVAADLIAQGAERKRVEAELERANRQKDEFLAMLAHELRNPLAPILAAVELLEHHRGSLASDERARQVIARQVEHLRRLVDDLLEVSRVTSGKIRLAKEPTDAGNLVAGALETSRPLIDAKGQELTVDVPDEPIRLEVDATRLVQVLTNLLNNAAKYTPEGGRIRLAIEQTGSEAVFRVHDTGIGIPPEMLRRVFDLFTQVDRSIDRSEGGLGIGLALVRLIVQLHGGTVVAFSEGLGKGSEFVVRIPALPRRAGAPGATTASTATRRPASTRRVLVVDDNHDCADMLSAALSVAGHEVKTTYTGRDALAMTASFRPDFVLLDLGLPDLDGFEVARRLRETPWGRAATLIACTGYGQPHDRESAEAAGFDHHLVKPFNLRTVSDLLATPPRASAWHEEAREAT
jgi:PAS domain S-box-containing protein